MITVPRRHNLLACLETLAIALVLAALPISLAMAQADTPPSPDVKVLTTPGAFTGKWTYRSYLNDPKIDIEPNDLLFGRAEINIVEEASGKVTGTIGGTGWSLNLTGKVTYSSDAAAIKVQGVGKVNGETWVYDYFGYLAPTWSTGIDQRPAILGSVIRTVPHTGGQAPAGTVASFLAVKQ